MSTPRRLRPPSFPLRPAWLAAWREASPGQLLKDLGAGLVVGLVAIPLAIAFAIASGVPPAAGLVTVVVAGSLAAGLAGSRTLVTGPAGAFVVLMFSIHAQFGPSKLVLAVFMAGVLLVLMGWFRLGRLVRFVPAPVVTGFTAGIAVVIAVTQLPDALGLRATDLPSETIPRLLAVARHASEAAPWPVALAVATVLVIAVFRRFMPAVPGPVVALVGLTALASILDVPATTIADRFGAFPSGLPAPRAPEVSWAAVRQMMPSAIAIALLAALETLLAAVVADGMTGQRHDSDQELVAQGVANVGSSLFGGLAATGAIARTATSIQNGGRTPLAAFVHVAVVVAVLYLAAPLAGEIPLAVLAGILLVVAWNMSERHRVARVFKVPGPDAGVFVAVFALTVFVDLTTAVIVGMVLAMAVFMHRMAEFTRVGPADPFDDEVLPPRYDLAEVPEGVVVYSIDGPFFFGAAARFQEALDRTTAPPRIVVLRMRNAHYLDQTGLASLEAAIDGLRRAGTIVLLAGVQAQPLDMMQRAGTFSSLSDHAVFRTTHEALLEADRLLRGDSRRDGPPRQGPSRS